MDIRNPSALALPVVSSAERPCGGCNIPCMSKSQRRKSRLRRNAVLKSIDHSEKLRSCLGGVIQCEKQVMNPLSIIDMVLRVENKLDMFAQAVLCKLESLFDPDVHSSYEQGVDLPIYGVPSQVLARQCQAVGCIQRFWRKRICERAMRNAVAVAHDRTNPCNLELASSSNNQTGQTQPRTHTRMKRYRFKRNETDSINALLERGRVSEVAFYDSCQTIVISSRTNANIFDGVPSHALPIIMAKARELKIGTVSHLGAKLELVSRQFLQARTQPLGISANGQAGVDVDSSQEKCETEEKVPIFDESAPDFLRGQLDEVVRFTIQSFVERFGESAGVVTGDFGEIESLVNESLSVVAATNSNEETYTSEQVRKLIELVTHCCTEIVKSKGVLPIVVPGA